MASGSFNLNVQSDINKMQRKLDHLHDNIVNKAAVSALNRTAQKVRTEARREVSKQLNLKQKTVKDGIQIKVKATRKSLYVVIAATGKPINLIEWVGPSKRKVGAFRKKQGVEAKPFGHKITKRGSFIGHAKNSGKLLVFRRIDKTNPKSKLAAQNGPSIPKTFTQKIIKRKLKAEAKKTWKKNFEHNVQYYLDKL